MGNIHSVNNPEEPVIGFISASSVQSKRVFINNKQLENWYGPPPGKLCGQITFIPQDTDPLQYLNFNYSDTTYGPYYFVTGGIAIAKNFAWIAH